MHSNTVIIRNLGLTNYQDTWQAMQDFNNDRTPDTIDEIWVLEHQSVYTQGVAGKAEHLLATTTTPVIRTNRGGQITYHGPGQLIIYLLLDLKRKKLGPKTLVSLIETTIIKYLASLNCTAIANDSARGVYVNSQKIASIGLRISKGYSMHGFALNVAMDLDPFNKINPCGIQNLAMTQVKAIKNNITIQIVQNDLIQVLTQVLNYDKVIY